MRGKSFSCGAVVEAKFQNDLANDINDNNKIQPYDQKLNNDDDLSLKEEDIALE